MKRVCDLPGPCPYRKLTLPVLAIKTQYEWDLGTPLPGTWAFGLHGSYIYCHNRCELICATALLCLKLCCKSQWWQMAATREVRETHTTQVNANPFFHQNGHCWSYFFSLQGYNQTNDKKATPKRSVLAHCLGSRRLSWRGR